MVCSGRKRPQLSNGQCEATPAGTALVGGGHEAEQQLRAGIVERCEAQLVDDDQVGPQETLDDAAHRVVGEAPVERLLEVGGAEVAHPDADLDRGLPERHEKMALAGAGGTDEHHVLTCPDPLQARKAWISK